MHLAAHLLGTEMVRNRLLQGNHNSSSSSSSSKLLYWRSKLFHDPLDQASSSSSSSNKILFLDLTFGLNHKGDDDDADDADDDKTLEVPSNLFSVRFGCFLLSQQPKYIQGAPMTLEVLEQHAQSLGIDLHSAPPKAMAGMMAQELLASGNNKIPNLVVVVPNAQDNKNNDCNYQLSLYYRDVQESGILSLPKAQSTTQWDRLGMRLLSWDWMTTTNDYNTTTNNDHDGDKEDDEDDDQLNNAFETWFQQQQPPQPVTVVVSSPATTTKHEPPILQKRRPASQSSSKNLYVPVSKKRKKKGKIQYANASST